MATNIGARVSLDGEREFKQALAEINAGLKVMASELALVTAKYSDNATSIEALTERGKVFENQVEKQREKVEKLREILAKATQTYGETDTRTQKWQVSLNKAQTELFKMESELKKNAEALRNVTDEIKKQEIAAREQEFNKALAEINAGLELTASELKLVTARYSDNEASVKALTERHEVLEKSIEKQREKMEIMRKALQNAAETYGKTDKKTLEWQISLNKAEAELIQMEKELQDNSAALQKATQDMEKYGLKEDEVAESGRSLGEMLSNVINSLGIHLPAGAEKAIKALDGTTASTMALIGVTAGIITGFAKTTTETAKMADELLTLSSVTGMSTDTLQELKYASEFVDVSMDTMTGAMTKMIQSMDDAQNGSKEASKAFRQLHLGIRDNNGQLKDSETMFYQVIDALGKVRNETERDALAMQIFGRSARELNPLIEAGSKRLKELGEEARQMGYIMDADALESFGQLDDAMQKFNKQTEAFKNSLAMVMLPVLTALFEMLNKIDPKILATVAIIAGVATVAVTVAKAIKSVTDVFGSFNVATLKTTAIIVGVVAALIALSAIIAVIIGKGSELDKTMTSIGNSVNDMTRTVNNAGNNIRIGRNAWGTDNWRGGLTWINERGGEIIDLPRGTRVIPHDVSMEMARNGTVAGSIMQNINVYVQANQLDEIPKIVRFFETLKQRGRQG